MIAHQMFCFSQTHNLVVILTYISVFIIRPLIAVAVDQDKDIFFLHCCYMYFLGDKVDCTESIDQITILCLMWTWCNAAPTTSSAITRPLMASGSNGCKAWQRKLYPHSVLFLFTIHVPSLLYNCFFSWQINKNCM